MLFHNRQTAGRQLAGHLSDYKENKEAIVLGLPRGGVVVAYEIAKELHLPLDVTCPRKIGAPFNPEYAIGAITETGQGILNQEVIDQLDVSDTYLQQEIEVQKQLAQRRLKLFRKDKPPRVLKGKIVILVDDGLATGATMKAAIYSAKHEGAKKVVVAIPVSPVDTLNEIREMVDEVVCLDTPAFFQAIGQFYRDFTQVDDEEVVELLHRIGEETKKSNTSNTQSIQKEVAIQLTKGHTQIYGTLTIPAGAEKIVVFAHGSGSGRYSPRNQFVANYLIEKGLATLLLDLLTSEEEVIDDQTRELRFNIPFLSKRLVEVVHWLEQQEDTQKLKVGFFGASTGAAAALMATSELGKSIFAVVSRGGRPDLAIPFLPRVMAPTLLIVGGDDFGVIELNQEAYEKLPSKKRLEIVPGATHLFEEPGTLEEVARLAASWFLDVDSG